MGKSPEYQPYLFSPDVQEQIPPHGEAFSGEQGVLFSDVDTPEAEEITLEEMTVILAPPNKRELRKKIQWSCVVATERDDTSLYILRATGRSQEQALTIRLHAGDVINASGAVTATDSARLHGITYQTTTVLIRDLHLVARAASRKLV